MMLVTNRPANRRPTAPWKTLSCDDHHIANPTAALVLDRPFGLKRNANRGLAVSEFAQWYGRLRMKQDKITINGPKNDGTYIVEFKTADGVALAFSVPKGGGTAVLEYFQDKMPYGLAVPDVPRSLSPGFYWLEPGGRSSTH
jgi:hypothetical protein